MGGVISALRSKASTHSRRVAPERKADAVVEVGQAGQALKTRELKSHDAAGVDSKLAERKVSVQVARAEATVATRSSGAREFKQRFAATMGPLLAPPGAGDLPALERHMAYLARAIQGDISARAFVRILFEHTPPLEARPLFALTRGFCSARPAALAGVIRLAAQAVRPWDKEVEAVMPILIGAFSAFQADAHAWTDRLDQQIEFAMGLSLDVEPRDAYAHRIALLGALIHERNWLRDLSFADYARICEATRPRDHPPRETHPAADLEAFLRCIPGSDHPDERVSNLHRTYVGVFTARIPPVRESKRPDDPKEAGAGPVPPEVARWVRAHPDQAAGLLPDAALAGALAQRQGRD